MYMRARAFAIGFGAAVTLLCVGHTTTAVAAEPPAPVLDFQFNGLKFGGPVTSVVNSGSSGGSVNTAVLTNAGGALVSAGAPDVPYRLDGNDPGAVAFPGYEPLGPSTHLAIVSITNPASVSTPAADPMNPKSGPFSFGADFRINDDTGTDPSDGDNVFQRGLNGATQWKLSVDHHAAVCSVKAAGEPAIKTPAITIPPASWSVQWYRTTCVRDATGMLTATVQAYNGLQSSWQPFGSANVSGAGIDLSMSPQTPVSIGGKLNANNTITMSAPDQLNGAVDNVRLTIG
jgi:hypothetical protein